MNEGKPGFQLPAAVVARKAAALPVLLAAVRRRRRRRRARSVVLIGLVALVAAVRWGLVGDRPSPAPIVPAPRWEVVADDPGIGRRVLIAPVARAEWFVDDAGLQRLLAAAGRPSGLVRTGTTTEVTKAAYDPWPAPQDLP